MRATTLRRSTGEDPRFTVGVAEPIGEGTGTRAYPCSCIHVPPHFRLYLLCYQHPPQKPPTPHAIQVVEDHAHLP